MLIVTETEFLKFSVWPSPRSRARYQPTPEGIAWHCSFNILNLRDSVTINNSNIQVFKHFFKYKVPSEAFYYKSSANVNFLDSQGKPVGDRHGY